MKKQTQLQFVSKVLYETGAIRRNYCLGKYISRLGSIMKKLDNLGIQYSASYIKVETPFGKSKDYEYVLNDEPKNIEILKGLL